MTSALIACNECLFPIALEVYDTYIYIFSNVFIITDPCTA